MGITRPRAGGGTYSASLSVDGRWCTARPMRGSALGRVSGLAVVAETESDVLETVAWMPGRVLVLCGDAITRTSAPVVVNSAHLATFIAIVVVTDDLSDLGHMGDDGLPIPVVVVSREADQSWLRRAVRVTVGVRARPHEDVDVRGHRVERRRRVATPAIGGVPGAVST